MATITLKGNPFQTNGNLPEINSQAIDFQLTASDLSTKTLADFAGKNVVLNIFPSVDTDTCAASVRKFNQELNHLDNTVVLCISKDLPFAQNRFCGAEGLENVKMLADYKTQKFSDDYGIRFVDGPLEGLLSRCVVAINPEGTIVYTEQVTETVDEPNYESVLAALK